MARLGGFLVVVAAVAAALVAPPTDAAAQCKRSPDAEQYPLLVQHGSLRVYGTVGEGSYCFPWGMCPDHPLRLTRRDFSAAIEAFRAARSKILGPPQPASISGRVERISVAEPTYFDRGLMLRLCIGGDANGAFRTLILQTDGDIFWLSRLAKGWVVWHRF